jgi:serine protease Do
MKQLFSRHKNIIIISLLTSLFLFAAIAAGVVLYISANRAAVFNYFASHFIEELNLQENGEKSGAEAETRDIARNLVTQESLVIDAVKRTRPAVISIVITKDVPVIEQYYEEINPFFDFFGDDFGFRVPRYREKGVEPREVGSGSGFLISPDGLAVTNRHVVNDEDASYTAFTNDGEKHEVEVIAKDPFFDIAIIKLKGKGEGEYAYLSFADSDTIQVGQTVIAIGNALGEFRNTVSVGVVSGLSRSIIAGDESGRSELLDEVIQTDAAINPGNSGGPLLNLNGRVVGVNVAVARGSENIGFALPANIVKTIVESVEQHGKIVRPFLGVRYMVITKELKEKNKLPVDYGMLIVRGENPGELAVVPGSPADKAGLVENDIILEVDGVKLDGDKTLASVIRRKQVGDTIKLKVLSKGEEKIITATLEEMPE